MCLSGLQQCLALLHSQPRADHLTFKLVTLYTGLPSLIPITSYVTSHAGFSATPPPPPAQFLWNSWKKLFILILILCYLKGPAHEMGRSTLHWNENLIYVFLFWELRDLSPNFHIDVSLSDLYIPRTDPHIFLQRIDRSIVGIYKTLKEIWMWK